MDKLQLSKNLVGTMAYDDAQTEAGGNQSNIQTIMIEQMSNPDRQPKGILKNADSVRNNNRISSQIQSIFNQI